MGEDRVRRIDRGHAGRLLDGAVSGRDPLSRLLAAARAPATADELASERSAVLAFRAARSAYPTVAARPAGRRRRAWPRILSVKAAAVALAVGVAGVAVAAGTGVLPNPLQDPDEPAAAPVVSARGPSSGGANHASPGQANAGTEGSGAGRKTPEPSTSADRASLVGLCHSYLARGDRDPSAAMGSSALAALAAAAGGADRVEAFCTALVTQNGAQTTPTVTPPASPGPGGEANPRESDPQEAS